MHHPACLFVNIYTLQLNKNVEIVKYKAFSILFLTLYPQATYAKSSLTYKIKVERFSIKPKHRIIKK